MSVCFTVSTNCIPSFGSSSRKNTRAPPMRKMRNKMTTRMKSQYPKDLFKSKNPIRKFQKDSSFVSVSGSIKRSKIITPRRDTKRNQLANHSRSSSTQFGQSMGPNSPSSNALSKLQLGHWMTAMVWINKEFLNKILAGCSHLHSPK